MMILSFAVILTAVDSFNRAGFVSRTKTLLQVINNPTRLAELEKEYQQIKSNSAVAGNKEREKELSIIVRCAEALREIDADLIMMQDHLKGEDMKLKETAQFFGVEFEQCKTEIEGQLNALLDAESATPN